MTDVRALVGEVYRTESRTVLATLVRLLGDVDLAESALHDAVVAALEQWPRDGPPRNPASWLVSTGRFRTIDRIRRRARFDAVLGELAARLEAAPTEEEGAVTDDRLRLVFLCCHPVLAPDAAVALTLRTVCGLTTEEIAAAYLTRTPTLAQRIVRAKATIRDAGMRYEVPEADDLPARLDAVLRVVYLMFTQGYAPSAGAEVTRPDLSAEAIRLGRLLRELLPDPEVTGLLALMLLHDARRGARTGPDGELVLLEDQDRALWERDRIAEGSAMVREALAARPVGAYALQAAIAAVHADPDGPTDWAEVVGLYDLLRCADPSPMVELNRAVAVAMRDGPDAGLALVDGLLAHGDLARHHLAHATRADLLRRLGRTPDAADAYRRARELATAEPERRFLDRRLNELGGPH
jgi:RNA polymerase sigma-70 factor, ECF subfamily